MKPALLAVDEMFPEGAFMDTDETTCVTGVMMDLGKEVHGDFYDDFGDLFDDGYDDDILNLSFDNRD